MIIYARKNMIFHVYDVNLVQNSDVSDLSLTLTAYNFFPVHFQTQVPKEHLISIKFPFEWYIKHIFLKEPKFPSLVPQAIFDDVTKIRKFGPFRSFSDLRQNFFGILVKFPIRKHTFLLLP